MSNRILRCGVLLALVLLLAGTTALAADYRDEQQRQHAAERVVLVDGAGEAG